MPNGVSYGYSPYSMSFVSQGYEKYAMSSLDILAEIAGIFWPLRSIKWAKNFKVDEEYGTGSLDPLALINKEHAYAGDFTFASFLVTGQPAMTQEEYLALAALLTDQKDEGRAIYFPIMLCEVPGKRSPGGGYAGLGNEVGIPSGASIGFIETLINCKVTKIGRDYPDKDTIVTPVEFKFSRKMPA